MGALSAEGWLKDQRKIERGAAKRKRREATN
jgi:hypothetical protein